MTLTPRMTGLLAVLLVASLAVNFFVAGIIVSHVGPGRFHGHFPFGHEGPNLALRLKGAPGALSPDGVKKLMEAVRAHPEDMKEAAEALRKARDKARDVLRQDTFDAAAFKAAQQNVAEATMAMQTAAQAHIAEVAAQLSPEDRKVLASLPMDGRLDVMLGRGGRAERRIIIKRGPDGPGGFRDFQTERGPDAPPPPPPGGNAN